ncbi:MULTISPECIES: UDP-glucose 4-epimerase family protein [Halomonadaceae]|uniref:NAD-dependent epimerase/dehydratase family protein n=1 Tax=Vreelandella halophila TaxID=86177 RepID=A0A9X4Y830_9GAMM|nr:MULTISPECIES: SDR family oxidoreductase [Halomonas]MYL25277.1 NAD-dependent epimerase/dehydratase family protein [Halomonas utahensis]MYL75339.1 NAD-dependent epimerase/dehydratase family protein [Halomonas sp. 22501_18_FS]
MTAAPQQQQILVTGATGFVGRQVTPALSRVASVTAAVRSPGPRIKGAQTVAVGPVDGKTDWQPALAGVEAVVHLAARAHVMKDEAQDPLSEFRRTNTEGTRHLAEQAASAGVRRFIFISSIKVNGESTAPGRPFTAHDIPAPQDPYGQSKAEAEQALRAVAASTGMEVVIIRPPLIHGPGVKGNFAVMLNWLRRGIPLPLGRTDNARSLLAVDNLVDLITTCLNHPDAANQTFLASDGEDVSTTQLLRRMAAALGKPARLLPVPPPLMKFGARMIGREPVYQRLFGSLQLDIRHTRETLGWAPPLTMDEGLRQTANALRKH